MSTISDTENEMFILANIFCQTRDNYLLFYIVEKNALQSVTFNF